MQGSAETPGNSSRSITAWLTRAGPLEFSLYAVGASFCAYFCMYGYRKAFAAATYQGQTLDIGVKIIQLKAMLVISQVIGYTSSKYLGVKFLSELPRERRIGTLIGAILCAEGSLLLFGCLPVQGQVIAIFLNGLPLGIVWGLVYSFLEGRQTSEILGAGLSCSFIVASGFAKTVGSQLMAWGVPEPWMPALVGVCYFPFFLASVWLLKQIPRPSEADVEARVKRDRMNARQRLGFLARHLGGLVLLLAVYFFLTAYREFRDNYVANIWEEQGVSDPVLFTKTEIPIAFAVMVALALLYLVKDNRRAFFRTHLLMVAGTILIGASTVLFELGVFDVILWMTVVGLGLYMAYVPYGCVLFDRMIAAMGTIGTAVFAIYVADALGYTGGVCVILYKEFAHTEMEMVEFFRYLSYFTSLFCTLGLAGSWIYWRRKKPPREATEG